MSRIRDYNINMDSSVTIGDKEDEIEIPENINALQIKDVMEPIILRAKEKAQQIISEARAQAKKEIDELKASKELIEQEIEKLKQSAYEKSEKQGYDTGYAKGYEEGMSEAKAEIQAEVEKAQTEIEEAKSKMEEELLAVDTFAKSNFDIKNQILSSTRGDILNLCFEISKKVCLKALDADILGKIIDKALLLLDTKSQVNVMISPILAEKLPENFESKFMNIRIIKNSKLTEDSIIVESLAGNIDCTISTQIDKIIDEILNGKSD